ncbi:hypothetical protein ACJX0J_037925, partial [Zea mays]
MDNMNLQGWEEILKRDFSILIVEYISLLYKNKGPKMNLQGWEEILKRDFSIFIKNQSNKQYKNKGPKMNHQHIYGVLGKMVITDFRSLICLPRLFELYLNIIDQEGTTNKNG